MTILSASAQLKPIEPGVYHWKDLPVKKSTDRESRRIFEGTSPHFEYLEIHATTQMPGAKPSPPHDNKDIEEIIIVKEGKMKATIGEQSAVLGAGSVILILPLEMQTFENVGDTPLTYYVMRYRSRKPMDIERGKSNGGSLLLNQDSLEFKTTAKGGSRAYFDRPTSMCENFEMHVTQLDKKGPSHAPHTHVDTEVILVIDGTNEVIIEDKKYNGTTGDLYFINSGLSHNGGNGSDATCTYFAFKWR
jgi:(S)-ureidoglycine aminohydrolase